MIVVYILEVFFIVILLGVFVALCFWAATFFSTNPFIPVPQSVLGDIYQALNLKEGSVLHHVGCGDGRVLFYCAEKNPNAAYYGTENSTVAVMLARVRQWWYRNKAAFNINIEKKDSLQQELSHATHIFLYTSSKKMDDMLQKLEKECTRGTRIVSLSFRFTVRQPTQQILLQHRKNKHASTLFIYDF